MKMDKKVRGLSTFTEAEKAEIKALKKNVLPGKIEDHNISKGMFLWQKGDNW